jgi:hypothetical protein
LDDHTTNDFEGGGGGKSSGACDPSLLRASRTGSDLSTGAGRSMGADAPPSNLGATSFCAGASNES